MSLDLAALERAAPTANPKQPTLCTTVRLDELAALVAIARAAAAWRHAVQHQTGTAVERSLLADRLAIALERAGL